MKKINTILIVLILAIVSLFGFVGCESSSQNDLQSKIDELQSRIDELEEQIQERDDRIKELEEENMGKFYTLQESYDNGFLTKEDLEQIAYLVNNELSYPQKLESDIENAIKDAAAYEMRNRKIEPYLDASADGFTIVRYCGVYSGNYVIIMRNDYDIFPTDVPSYWKEIGGVQFHFVGYDSIVVWREKV